MVSILHDGRHLHLLMIGGRQLMLLLLLLAMAIGIEPALVFVCILIGGYIVWIVESRGGTDHALGEMGGGLRAIRSGELVEEPRLSLRWRGSCSRLR
jgi:hypothetical protein